MDKDFIKEALNNYRLNKTLFWNTLIITVGGFIGVLFKALGTKNNSLEIILLIIGGLLIIFLFYAISLINETINKLWLQLRSKKEQ